MIYISKNWFEILRDEFEKEYFKSLQQFLNVEYVSKTIYPENEKIFNAFIQTKFEDVKVVIIGQDPYINEHQAHGLCFSVERGSIPPSLCNIYKEIRAELGAYIPNNGNLTKWARQGVLLLNSVLTVESGKSNSHKNRGWEIFTHEVVSRLAHHKDPIVFMLWGANARKVIENIDLSRHLVLTSAHPSPMSATSGFFGNGHFKKCNEYLEKMGKKPIDWQIENI